MSKPKEKRRTYKKRDDKSRNQTAFLEAFAESGIIRVAASQAGISHKTVYEWREDEEFVERYDLAFQAACDKIEEEIRRRAEEGWDEPVYQGGEFVGVKRKYSDLLLIARARAFLPEKYKDRSNVDITSGGQPIKVVANIDIGEL